MNRRSIDKSMITTQWILISMCLGPFAIISAMYMNTLTW